MKKFKSGTRYKWEGWRTSGREGWVFDVDHPKDLMGVHAKLIDKELKSNEKIAYCIYSPRRSFTSAPFGFETEEASCGFCLTGERFIITKNRHLKGIEPTLETFGISDIVYFNTGTSMLLSWVALSYVSEGNLKQAVVLFSTTGKHHFEKALCSYKKCCRDINMESPDMETFSPAQFLNNIRDDIHRDHLRKLITSNERCIFSFSFQYIVPRPLRKILFLKKVGKPYSASNSTALLTTSALLLARNGTGFSVGNCTDVLNVPLNKVGSLKLIKESLGNRTVHKIKIDFVNGAKPLAIRMALQDNDLVLLMRNIRLLLGDKYQRMEQ